MFTDMPSCDAVLNWEAHLIKDTVFYSLQWEIPVV